MTTSVQQEANEVAARRLVDAAPQVSRQVWDRIQGLVQPTVTALERSK